MRSFSLVAILFFLSLNNLYAQELSARYFGLSIEGGATAGYYYSNSVYRNSYLSNSSTSPALNENADNIVLSDLLLEFRSKKMTNLDAEIQLGVGSLQKISILDGNANYAFNTVFENTSSEVTSRSLSEAIGLDDQYDMNVHYGQVTLAPFRDTFIEAGQLATNLGYEVSPTYANWNSLLGLVWTKQPTYYPGVRLRYEVNQANVYAEYNQDGVEKGDNAWVLGVYGRYAMVRYSASYFDTNDGRNVADLMIEADLPHTIVALNFDFHLLDETPAGTTDRSAYAIAAYAIPYYKRYYFPLRLEYVNEGDSNIFGLNRGYTITFSPTAYLTENAFVRAEGSFVSSYNSVFKFLSDKKSSYTNWALNAQIGYYF